MTRKTKPKNPRFEVYLWCVSALSAGRPAWGWRLYARNGEIVAHGESYGTRKDAARAIAAVKRAVLGATDLAKPKKPVRIAAATDLDQLDHGGTRKNRWMKPQ